MMEDQVPLCFWWQVEIKEPAERHHIVKILAGNSVRHTKGFLMQVTPTSRLRTVLLAHQSRLDKIIR